MTDTTETPLRELPLKLFGAKHETDSELITYIVVGRAIIIWGGLEQNFNNVIATIYRKYGGADLVREPPFQLKRKIEFWNLCFQKLDALAEHKQYGLNFGRDLGVAKKQRDTLLHFAWETRRVGKPLRGRNLRAGTQGHTPETIKLPLRSINELATTASNLNFRLMAFWMNVHMRQPPR